MTLCSTNGPRLSDCWAKTNPVSGIPALTVRDHCLAVGSVAMVALEEIIANCRQLAPNGTACLTAAHDIGKISPGFLCKSPYFAFAPPRAYECESNHAKVSQAYLASRPEMRDERGRPWNWTLAADGHHGRYHTDRAHSGEQGSRSGLNEGGLEWPHLLRDDLLEELIAVFGPLPTGPVSTGAQLHWLTGFTTFCDWIGSNADWFPLQCNGSLSDHYTPEAALALARNAIDKIGWHRRSVRQSLEFGDLFRDESGQPFQPRPLQRALCELSDEAGLYLVEAPMGLGKTEAALAAAYRRWSNGGERGLYFALPTQLTSNRIHDRIVQFLERVVDDNEVSQTLVHGNAWLRSDRVRTFNPARSDNADDAREATAWFASSRKALLAPFGTGTLDQALMACIAVKHSSLRLFALSGKVVVMDEVHSYDPFTSKLIDLLIPWLLEVGCSVFILSATLSSRRRRELISAAGSTAPSALPSDYPLLTSSGRGKQVEFLPVADDSLAQSCVGLELRPTEERSWLEHVRDAAEAGACVLIVRNTVALAQDTFRIIKGEVREGAAIVGLLHSRFPQYVRDSNEALWMERLGKGDAKRPSGCVLVATQVVEQSVDIDADFLVTDLAPTDLLLQRIGRLHRHRRSRPDGYRKPNCIVLLPEVDWNASSKEIKKALAPHGRVYPPVSLFQAWQVWSNRKSIILPAEIRSLVEAGDIANLPETVPPGVADLRSEMESKIRAMAGAAQQTDPFRHAMVADTEAQTRWVEQPSTLLTLLRTKPVVQGRQIRVQPLEGETYEVPNGLFHFPLAKALHESAVRIPWYLVKNLRAPDWLTPLMRDTVCGTLSPDSTTVDLIGIEDPAYTLHYHPEVGISHARNTVPTQTFTLFEDENDSWF